MRLNKFIAACGVCSRRKADTLIAEGRILINNSIITDFSYHVDLDSDQVEYNGQILKLESEKKIYVFRKPKECLTTVTDDRGRRTILDYFKTDLRLYPVGRLDYHSTGVLLVTNDGEFYQTVKYVDKSYHVQIRGSISSDEISRLESGVIIDDQKTQPCRIHQIKSEQGKTWLEFILNEGRNRQIRKMLDTIGKKVVKLDRIRFGSITYDRLKPGEYRELTDKEIQSLLNLAKKQR